MATVSIPADPRVVLSKVSWETYESLLADLADSSGPRLTYDRGELEITSPTPEHEKLNRLLADLIGVLAEELDIDTENLGSSTFRRGVLPEVWRYDGSTLRLMKLQGQDYAPTDSSVAFPRLTASVLEDFLAKSKSMRRPDLLKVFREWIRSV